MSAKRKLNIVAVDDDGMNLAILIKGIKDEGHEIEGFKDSRAAWLYLKNNPSKVDIALLDKMMPGMDGIEMLRKMKEEPELRHIPVIIQTGDVGVQQMQEGLNAGAYYYLTKPFHPEILTAIINSAANDCELFQDLKRQIQQGNQMFEMMQEGKFYFDSIFQARTLSAGIAQLTDHAERVGMGLFELMMNAIEHGNLEMGFEGKRDHVTRGTWLKEIGARSKDEKYFGRLATLEFSREVGCASIVIRDEGLGFDWKNYLKGAMDNLRLDELTGRGIVKALASGLKDLSYNARGNEARCLIMLREDR